MELGLPADLILLLGANTRGVLPRLLGEDMEACFKHKRSSWTKSQRSLQAPIVQDSRDQQKDIPAPKSLRP